MNDLRGNKIHGSQCSLKPKTTLLARASSNLFLCHAMLCGKYVFRMINIYLHLQPEFPFSVLVHRYSDLCEPQGANTRICPLAFLQGIMDIPVPKIRKLSSTFEPLSLTGIITKTDFIKITDIFKLLTDHLFIK